MTNLDEFFKFKIGATVKASAHGQGWDDEGRRHVAQVLVVVERWLVECHGGVQMQYMVRAHTLAESYRLMGYSFAPPLFQMSEPELEEYAKPKLSATKPQAKRDSAEDVP
jgi:hypothetical protein